MAVKLLGMDKVYAQKVDCFERRATLGKSLFGRVVP